MKNIRRAREVLEADFGPRKVVFHTADHLSYVLNDTASDIWNYCRGPKSMDDIIEDLMKRYDLSKAGAKRDAVRFIGELEKRRLVKVYE